MVQSGTTKKIFDGRFEIVGIVGRGSQSVVYHAQNALSPDNHVALKVLVNHGKSQSAAQLGERLRKEALAMVAARHRYVIRIEDFHSLDSLCYLSMEYAPEGDLRKYVSSRQGKLPPAQAEKFFLQVVEALCAVHKSGIIHRDIKPDNILVLNDREIRLGDFGTAVLPGDDASIAELQKGVGTFAYMAPEVLEGTEYQEAADIYSLGVTFYELLTGKHPFDGVPLMEQLKVRRTENLKPIQEILPSLSRKFSQILMKCLSFKKEDRPRSAEEILEFMSGVAPAEPVTPSLAKKVEVISEPPPQKPKAIQVPPPISRKPTEEFSLSSPAPVTAQPITQPIPPAPVAPPPPLKMPIEVPAPKPVQSQLRSDLLNVKPSLTTPTSSVTKPVIPSAPAKEVDADVKDAVRDIISGKAQPKKQAGPKVDIPAAKRIPGAGIIFILMLLAAYWRFGGFSSQNEITQEPQARMRIEDPEVESQVPSSDEPLVPKTESGKIAFPLLPSGMYHGEIHGLYPGSHHSLTLISFADRKRLAVIVGIEGFRPAVVSTEGLKPGDPLKVSANGFVLHLTGQLLEDGEIVGFFKNLVVRDQGEWRVKQLKSVAIE